MARREVWRCGVVLLSLMRHVLGCLQVRGVVGVQVWVCT